MTGVILATVRERDASDVDWSSGDDVEAPSDHLPDALPDAYSPTLTVEGYIIPDSDGENRRAAIKLSWPESEVELIDSVHYEVRLLSDSSMIASSTANAKAGEVVVSDGIVASEIYEARARYMTGQYPSAWSAWIPAASPDVRLSAKDIVDAYNAKVDAAFERHDQALETLTSGNVFDLLNETRITDAIIAAQNVSNSAQDVIAFEEVGDAAAAIVDERIARVYEDGVLASDLTTLTGRVGDNEGSIYTLQATKVDAAGAVAAVEQKISVKYNDMTAMANATSFAEATVNGIASGYVWQLNGSNILELVSVQDGVGSTPVSTARIDSDYVQITGLAQINQAVINTLAADTGFISNLTVDTLNLAGNSATAAQFSKLAAQKDGTGAFISDALTGMITIPKNVTAQILYVANFSHGYSSGAKEWGFRIRTTFDYSPPVLERSGMQGVNDYPAVAGIVTHTTSGSAVSFAVSVDWWGEDSTLKLRTDGTTLSLFARWK